MGRHVAFVESQTFSVGVGSPIDILTFLLFMSPCMSPTLFFVITYAYCSPLCDHLLPYLPLIATHTVLSLNTPK